MRNQTFHYYQNLKCITGHRIDGPIWQKKLVVLIHNQFLEDRQAIFHDWISLHLSPFNDMWKERFLNLEPNLKTWENILIRGIEKETFYFVITMLEVYNIILDPHLWKGMFHSAVLMLYYINLNKLYFVYVENEQQYFKYTGKCWENITPSEINDEIINFFATIKVSGGKQFTMGAKNNSTLLAIRDHIKLKSWPFVSGYNCKNRFFHLRNNQYTLAPHHPSFWQREYYDRIYVPNEIIPKLTPLDARWLRDVTGEIKSNMSKFKLTFFYNLGPLRQNIIMYIHGNPSAGKSVLTSVLQAALVKWGKAANLERLNPFQLDSLLRNTTTLVFSNQNLASLRKESIGILKGLSGNDTLMAKKKFENSYTINSKRLFTIVTGNKHLNDISQNADPVLVDRLLGFEMPGVSGAAITTQLEPTLQKSVSTFAF